MYGAQNKQARANPLLAAHCWRRTELAHLRIDVLLIRLESLKLVQKRIFATEVTGGACRLLDVDAWHVADVSCS